MLFASCSLLVVDCVACVVCYWLLVRLLVVVNVDWLLQLVDVVCCFSLTACCCVLFVVCCALLGVVCCLLSGVCCLRFVDVHCVVCCVL